ncbi:ABC transporter ATP-binding protein [Corynebacterium mendelii]|uniref:ATP-binding cassette domain-containing protein n=1 Tax=Corynebacterium mendelii TaxID=2765362 RepID=A0A939IWV1_9CORY|nr:ATP-binding cassette domain-containing protein [Corynebacterium mendelii]MBN9643820.1 ATP-binding cassette domain-containing protein [Corynebacterium mendelii]
MAESVRVGLKQFSYANTTIVHDIDLVVERGECIVLTGSSGCGKTTLIRLINGLIPALYDGDVDGSIHIRQRRMDEYRPGEIAKYVGNVFQNPNDQFFSKTVEGEVALIGENMGMPVGKLRHRVDCALHQTGIAALRNREVRQLSGGQKQKVAVASTLVFDSGILVLDEPSANLDYTATHQLGDILGRLKQQGKTIIIAEHRLAYLAGLADRVVVMEAGRISDIIPAGELAHGLERRHGLRCLNEDNLTALMPPPSGEPAVTVDNLRIDNGSYSFPSLVDFVVHRGECMAVIGDNGVGKTTLAKQLKGLLPLRQGRTSYGQRQRARRKNVSIALQNCVDMFFSETVEKELIPRDKRNDPDYLARVKQYLIDFELWDKRTLNPHDLSGGEKQRLAVLIALLEPSELVILDEPTAGLDYRRMVIVADAIREKIITTPVILITHDLELLYRTCNTVYMLSRKGNSKHPVSGNERRILEFFQHAGKKL